MTHKKGIHCIDSWGKQMVEPVNYLNNNNNASDEYRNYGGWGVLFQFHICCHVMMHRVAVLWYHEYHGTCILMVQSVIPVMYLEVKVLLLV